MSAEAVTATEKTAVHQWLAEQDAWVRHHIGMSEQIEIAGESLRAVEYAHGGESA